MKIRNVMLKYGAPAALTLSSGAFADTATQPDTSAVISYIGAAVATVLAVFVAKYGVSGAVLIGRWVKKVIGG